MLFQCPKCGKVIEMTLEELALSRKVVVCPQCLNEFLAQGVDIPATTLRSSHAGHTTGATAQIYCHNCGESLPATGLRYCPYCGASQNLAGLSAATASSQAPARLAGEDMGESQLTSPEDKTVVEDDAHDMLAHLPLIRPLPRLRSKREVMGGPWTRAICYIIIFVLLVIFLGILYISNFDDEGEIARKIGLAL